jgi:cytochrome b561
MKESTAAKYHPALVALHWLLAALIVFSLAMGFFALAKTPNSSPDKLFALRGHMAFGVAILILMLGRFAVRLGTRRPPPVTTGYGFVALPQSFTQFMPRCVHGVLAWLLLALIALHVAAALFHQLVRRDRLLSRMAFKKGSGPFFVPRQDNP